MPKEMWRVRTYGLHFLDNYFPHWELGICYYNLGAYTNAQEMLGKSLAQEPTGRAILFMDRVNTELLKQQHEITQLDKPIITLSAESDVLWATNHLRTLSGQIMAMAHVNEMFINGERQFIERADREWTFSQELPLHYGTNLITLEAQDLLG